MTDARKTLRSAAYYNEDRRGYDIRYWVMSPAWQKPGYQIRLHETGNHGALSSRLYDDLPEKEALLKMVELEQTAVKLRVVEDDNEFNQKKLGKDYTSAAPHAPYSQALLTEMNSAKLKLKANKPNLKLKP